jgi:glycosyltransferase involved in cell wall biosynthesis
LLTRRLYYWVKPFFSRRVQIAFRRLHARLVLNRSIGVWPIKQSAARKPDDWPGWPDGKRFGLILTHDVEGAGGVARVKKLAELEMKYGFRSSFNFVPEGGYEVPSDLRQWLTDRGFEVGVQDLHHDAKLYRSRKHFAESARRINQYINDWNASGFRSAFMLHNLEWLHDLNVLYDASTFDTDPFEPQPDGMDTIFPFWVEAGGGRRTEDGGRRAEESGKKQKAESRKQKAEVRDQKSEVGSQKSEDSDEKSRKQRAEDRGQRAEDGDQRSEVRGQKSEDFSVSEFQLSAFARAQRARGYVELPYTLVQDFNLFIILQRKTIDIWKQKLDWIVQHEGMVLLDTHPDYMAFDGSSPEPIEYPAEHYEELLTYVRSRYADQYWHALPRELASYVVETRKEAEQPALAPLAKDGASTGIGAGSDLVAANLALEGVAPRGQDFDSRLQGSRTAVLLFSHYPADPRPRRAAEALIAEGGEVDLLCLQQDANDPREEIVNGVHVFRVPLRKGRGSKLSYVAQYATFLLASFSFLASRAVGRRYDVVHVQNMPDVLVFGALIPKILGAKVILDLHDPMPELMRTIFKIPEASFGVNLLKRLERWSIAFADSVLTVNLACKHIYSSRSCRPEKINVVLNAPDEKIFEFRAPASSGTNGKGRPFNILYHGSLVSRNGFDLAVDALEAVRTTIPSARLVVCGRRTPYFDEVMQSATARGLSSHVEYLGSRTIEQVAETILECDLGIIPNHRNIFTEINTPTRIFEYLALGKPVIAPRAPGIRDYFGDDDLIFFELGDARDLAHKIEFAFNHRLELAEIVRRGQAVYRAHTWSQEKKVLLKAVGDLVV